MKNTFRRCSISALLYAAVIFSFSGCTSGADGYLNHESNDIQSQVSHAVEVQHADFDEVKEYDKSSATVVTFSGLSIAVDGTGCTADGSTLTITDEGTYILSGSLDGQVIVNADGKKIRLVLSGADITCSDSSPIYIKDAKKVTVTLADGTENILTDGAYYIYDDADKEEPNAALFSKADLILEGSGALTVNASFNNGIQSKDTLEIHSGKYTVNSANHGITGKDSLAIKDGTFVINAGGDGMRSNNSDEAELGWISIAGGDFSINAGQDGMQSETTLHIGGGSFSIVTGGGSANSSPHQNGKPGIMDQDSNIGGLGGDMSEPPEGHGGPSMHHTSSGSTDISAKAIKAGDDVLIENGTLTIDSSDDALHSNGDLSLTGGTLSISSGDDGIHADATMNISGGEITITKSYEGIEGVSVNISGGHVDLIALDDGINSAGGNDGDSDRPGANAFVSDDSCDISISGGVVIVDASGDGIDSNGDLHVSGGTLVVNGPTDNRNGPIDYDGEFIVSGGSIAVSGSAGMAQGASPASTQANMLLCFTDTISGGTMLSLTDSSGNVLFAATPHKDYASMFVSVPSMSVGDEYTIRLGGTCSAESVNGIYSGGTLTGATEITRITISEISTCYDATGDH